MEDESIGQVQNKNLEKLIEGTSDEKRFNPTLAAMETEVQKF